MIWRLLVIAGISELVGEEGDEPLGEREDKPVGEEVVNGGGEDESEDAMKGIRS
jgi:hypothetical protein